MVKSKIWKSALAGLMVLVCSTAQAALISFDSSNTVSSDSWTASSESTGQWYSSGYSTDNGVAELTESSSTLSTIFGSKGTSSILYSVSLEDVTAGTYNWSMDTRYSSSLSQYNYGTVYLAKSGQSIDLTGKNSNNLISRFWGKKSSGLTSISKDGPGLFTGNEQWHTFGSEFSLSQKELAKYDTIAFVFTGSKNSKQILEYSNFNTDLVSSSKVAVPEPATLALVASGAFMVARRRRTN